LDNSIFVIYGDHRPGSDEEMNNELIRITGKSLYNSRSSCVPIIIAIPGQERLISKFKNDYQKTVGGLYDIFPTIMHLLGIESPFGVYGSHLFVKNAERDPVPFYRYADSFIYNGIQYTEQGRKIATDKLGIIFTDDKSALGLNISETHKLWKQAQLSIHVSNYIYASNIDVSSLKP
jgi:phosphoglycerol transferase MdoB-like AlkP superfamily enzyme